jgi:hypothetical protein
VKKLRLESLEVESFSTGDEDRRGTVAAFSPLAPYSGDEESGCGPCKTPDGTCDKTCYGNGYTCEPTCFGTCPGKDC